MTLLGLKLWLSLQEGDDQIIRRWRVFYIIVIPVKLEDILELLKLQPNFYNQDFIGFLFLKIHLILLPIVIDVKGLGIYLGKIRCL